LILFRFPFRDLPDPQSIVFETGGGLGARAMMSGIGMKLILVTLFLFAATFASPRTAWGGHSSYGWVSTADIDPRAFIAEPT
jgi:hypothetical protein